MNESCIACKFSVQTLDEAGSVDGLECHKNPPKASRMMCEAIWPKVDNDDWCGEFVQDRDYDAENQ